MSADTARRRDDDFDEFFTGECPDLPTAPVCLGSAPGGVGTAGGVDVHPPETSAARPSIVEALAQIDRLREQRDDARAAVHELASQLAHTKHQLAQHQRQGW